MSQVCPYCKAGFTAEEATATCDACDARHHSECWQENGTRCAVFGCSSRALVASHSTVAPVPTAQATSPGEQPVVSSDDLVVQPRRGALLFLPLLATGIAIATYARPDYRQLTTFAAIVLCIGSSLARMTGQSARRQAALLLWLPSVALLLKPLIAPLGGFRNYTSEDHLYFVVPGVVLYVWALGFVKPRMLDWKNLSLRQHRDTLILGLATTLLLLWPIAISLFSRGHFPPDSNYVAFPIAFGLWLLCGVLRLIAGNRPSPMIGGQLNPQFAVEGLSAPPGALRYLPTALLAIGGCALLAKWSLFPIRFQPTVSGANFYLFAWPGIWLILLSCINAWEFDANSRRWWSGMGSALWLMAPIVGNYLSPGVGILNADVAQIIAASTLVLLLWAHFRSQRHNATAAACIACGLLIAGGAGFSAPKGPECDFCLAIGGLCLLAGVLIFVKGRRSRPIIPRPRDN